MASVVKTLLKKARDAVREHDYKTAYDLSKAILKIDECNYHALVFLGVSAQELDCHDESLDAFKKAVSLDPDQLLAWKGLANFCEKNDKKSQDLTSAYEKMITLLENDKVKRLDVVSKLAVLYRENGDLLKSAHTLQLQAQLQEDSQAKYKTYYGLMGLFSNNSSSKDVTDLLDQAYEVLLKSELLATDDNASVIYKSYLLHLKTNKNGSLSECIAESRRIFAAFPQLIFALEFLCHILVQCAIEKENVFTISEMEKLIEDLKTNNCSPQLFNVASGVKHFSSKNHIEALKLFRQGGSTNWIEIDLLIATTQIELHDYRSAQQTVQLGLQKAKSVSLENRLTKITSHFYVQLARALMGQRLFDHALKALKKSEDLGGKTGEIIENECKTYAAVNEMEKAQTLLKENSLMLRQSSLLFLEGLLLICQRNYADAEAKFLKCLELEESCAVYHQLGVIKWEGADYRSAISFFLKAAKLDAFFGRNYLYLGHFYKQRGDIRKALQCYKKCSELDVADDESARAYSDILLETGAKEDNLQLLQKMIEWHGMKSPRWLWLRLGVIQLQMIDSVSAIASLQNALKLDYADVHCWECLGDAYFQQGSYNAAYKAFSKVASLRPDCIYSLFRMASIEQSLGCFENAVEGCKKILLLKSNYVPALKGLAETLLLQAKKYGQEFLFCLSKDYCLEALQVLSKLSVNESRLSCLWKLIGDACHILSRLGQHHFPVTFPSNLIDCAEGPEQTSLEKDQLIVLCSRSYLKALSVNGGIAGLWHDLGISYLKQFEWVSDECQRKMFGQKSLLCLQHAVSLEPNNHKHWTTLGVIAALADQNYALAQHSFIKSILVDSTNSEAWTNLGILYLLNENKKLTHDALSKAQSLEPANHIPWIGQALVAEIIGHEETLDLFRHATTLGNHREAFLGYAHWICKILQDKELEKTAPYAYSVYKTFSLLAATDGLVKYTANDKSCCVSFCLLAELLERMDLNRMALAVAERAVELQTKACDNDLAVRRYARILRNVGRKQEAIQQLQSIADPDIGIYCELALTYFLTGQFNEAYRAYAIVSTLAESEEIVSHVFVAMAMIATKLQDSQNAKTLLFQSFQKKPASVYGFMALCALGLLENDPTLVMAAIVEMHPYRHDPEYCVEIARLLASQYTQQGDVIGNLRQYSKAVHDQPNVAELWSDMASSILMWQPWRTKLAVHCAAVATCHNKRGTEMSLLLTMCHLISGDVGSCLRAAQRSVHMQPDSLLCWSFLLSTLSANKPGNSTLPKLFDFAKKIGTQQKKLKGWIKLTEVYMYLSKGELVTAAGLLKSMIEGVDYGYLPAVPVLAALTESGFPSLSSVVQQHPSVTLGWHALVKLLTSESRFGDAEICIREWLRSMAILQLPSYLKVTPLLLLALLALEASKKTNEAEKWLTLSQEALNEVLMMDSSCQAALFIQALAASYKDKKGLATSSLKRLLLRSSANDQDKWIEKITRRRLFQTYSSKRDVAGLKVVLEIAKGKNDKELVEKLMPFFCKEDP